MRSGPCHSAKICGFRLTRSCQARSQPGTSRPAQSFGRHADARAWRNSVMQNGLYVAVSAQVALQRRLETIADNVANMNTVGYRATGVSFETEMAKTGDAQARLRLDRLGLSLPARRSAGEDRQLARFRRAGRRLVRDSDAARTGLHPRRPRPHRQIGNAADVERRRHPGRRRRADHHRRGGRPVDRLGRRNDHPERAAGRRDRAVSRSTRAPP